MVIAAAWRLGGKGRGKKQEDQPRNTATVGVRGGRGQSHGCSWNGQEGLPEDLAVAPPIGPQGSPVLPLEVSFCEKS